MSMEIGNTDISGYSWKNAEFTCAHSYLIPELNKILKGSGKNKRIIDVGCGNGCVTHTLYDEGYKIIGIDPSDEGIKEASETWPDMKFFQRSAYDDLSKEFGRFDIVISMEVVEHVYAPRKYIKTIYDLLNPGGIAILSTPFHGYWKNLALSLTGKMDCHFTALWDNGHIKFWSVPTLTKLTKEVGFKNIKFYFVGRIPCIAKSMIAVVQK